MATPQEPMCRPVFKSSADESVNTTQRNDIVICTEPLQVNEKTSQPSLVQAQSQRFWHKKLRTYVQGRKISEADPDYAHVLAVNQPNLKKWLTIGCICFQQISMNLNASILPSAYAQLQAESGFSESNCTHCTGLFLIAYAFGCELWAPWSEESGRKKTLEASQALVNLTQVPQLAVLLGCMTNTGAVFGTMLPMRILGGLCSAGGSVTLGIVSDMWGRESHQVPLMLTSLASVMGSIVGAKIGGFLESFASPVWVIAVQIIFGFIASALIRLMPETRSSVLVTQEAKRRRKTLGVGEWSEYELNELPISTKEFWSHACTVWARPFKMLLLEPIVTFLSLISGFSDALIFSFLTSLSMVMRQWSFEAWQTGLTFTSIGLGYLIGAVLWWIDIKRQSKIRRHQNQKPERRMQALLYIAPMLPIAMLIFAWTATGRPTPWIVPQILLVFVGIANYAIYGLTIDYMTAAYGPRFCASATGGNGFMRDLLAGLSTYYVKNLYSGVGPRHLHLQLGSTILAALGFVLIIPIFVFYFGGRWFRERGYYAKQVKEERIAQESSPSEKCVT